MAKSEDIQFIIIINHVSGEMFKTLTFSWLMRYQQVTGHQT